MADRILSIYDKNSSHYQVDHISEEKHASEDDERESLVDWSGIFHSCKDAKSKLRD